MELSTIIAIASLLLSTASLVWVGGFRFSALIQEVKGLGLRIDKLELRVDKMEEKIERRFDKLETRMDNFQVEMHKFDVRLSAIEQHKH